MLENQAPEQLNYLPSSTTCSFRKSITTTTTTCMCVYYSIHAEVREQCAGVGSILQPWVLGIRSLGLNSKFFCTLGLFTSPQLFIPKEQQWIILVIPTNSIVTE